MSFLPSDYEAPAVSGKYMKLRTGTNRFRPVGPAIQGREFWKTEGSSRVPVRRRRSEPIHAHELQLDKEGRPERVKDFMAFPVLDRADGQLKILELTQVTAITAIADMVENPDWGDPVTEGYDISITRKGSGLDTEYSVVPCPKKPLTVEEKELIGTNPVNLAALFSNGDPFAAGEAKPASNGHAAVKSAVTDTTKVKEVKAATVNGRTKYGVVCENGKVYGTFDQAVAEYAGECAAGGLDVSIEYAHEGKYITLIAIQAMATAGAVPDDGSDIPF